MNTDLCKEVAAEIRNEARVGAFNMAIWFKVGGDPSDSDSGTNLTEAVEMQEQFDRIVEGRQVWEQPATFKSCDSAGCAAGTVLWVQMRKGLRYEHGTIEHIAEAELDLPNGAASDIFRKTDLTGFEIAEIFDGLADGTIVWLPFEQLGDGTWRDAGLYFNQGNGFDGDYEECSDTDLGLLANARQMVDVTRKELLKEKRVYRIQVEVAKAQVRLDDLKVQLQHELYPDDLVDSEPF